MTEQKIGNLESISLILTIIINHIIFDLPKSIIQTTSSSSILNVLFITLIAFLIVYLIYKLFQNFPGLDILDISKFLGGKCLKIILGILFICYILFTISILLRGFSEGLKIVFFPRTPVAIIMLLFLISIVIANKLGIASITHANMLFTPLILFNILFIFIANWDNFNFEMIYPFLGNGLSATFFSGISNLFAFSGIFYLYLIPPYLKESKDYKKVAFISIGISAFYLLISVATLLFMFPTDIIVQQTFPTYLAARFIQFGRFFQRLDAAFLLFWILSMISYFSIALHFILSIFKKITNVKFSKWYASLFAMLVFSIALLPQNIEQLSFLENIVYRYIVLFLIFAFDLGILVFANIKFIRNKKSKENLVYNEKPL